MKDLVKSFRVKSETLEVLSQLKLIYKIDSDSELFARVVSDIREVKEKTLVPIELCEEKDKELKALYVKLGELQGELNIYKQQALPKKSFWKKLFGG